MTHEERQARIRWMAAEAERLVEARSKLKRPANPVTLHSEQQFGADQPRVDHAKQENDSIAAQLVASLARRDRGAA